MTKRESTIPSYRSQWEVSGWALIILVLAIVAAPAAAQEPRSVTFDSLLAEMADLAGLAQYPDPPYTTRQFSSYDRRSTTPEDAENWFANYDVNNYLRVEEREGRKEYVMMDADGPGAIVRIWSANPKGTLRIYLDGAETPVIAETMTDFLGGKLAWNPMPISGERSRGWNSYLPIPYATHCKVTSDEDGFYYHVNYRTYPAGTSVETVSLEAIQAADEEVRAAAEALAGGPASLADTSADAWTTTTLAPGETAVIHEHDSGPGIIESLAVAPANGNGIPTLHGLVLSATFDGEKTVEVPLVEFFGGGPAPKAKLETAPTRLTSDTTLVSNWVMPFGHGAKLELRHAGESSTSVRTRVQGRSEGASWNDRLMHFHAAWKQAKAVPTRPMQDWNYIDVQGKGVFVGAAFSIANPVRQWWGEGDEKIYVDGETFPSFFGTGTEDYYGYAWCCNVPFTHAYHAQSRCDGPGNYGHTTVNRWHILDRVPFEKSLRFDMELWHWNETAKVDMSVVTYWYARPGATHNAPPITPEALTFVELPPYVPKRVAGAIEGELMRIVEHTAKAEPQDVGDTSNDLHLWWHGGVKPGDKLTLAFDAPSAGNYQVLARFVKAGDYGIHALTINDQPVSGPIDLYHDGVTVSDEMDLGVFHLTSGANRLTVEVVGANEKALPAYLFGLDYVRILHAPQRLDTIETP